MHGLARIMRTLVSRPLLFVVLILWSGAALLFWLSSSPVGEVFAVKVAYWASVLFTAGALAYAALRASWAGRVFWSLLLAGLLLRLVGETGQSGLPFFNLLPPVVALNDVSYAVSYALLFFALLWLAAHTVKNVTPLAALDTLGVAISSGLLIWYFVLGPASVEEGLEGPREVLRVLTGPVCDVGLLYLVLVAAAADRRPPFVNTLLAAATVFVVAEGFRLRMSPFEMRPFDPVGFGGWPELVWTLGVALLGVTALRGASRNFVPQRLEVNPRRVSYFWLGPLSPLAHYGFLLAWGAFHPPLPSYALLGGAALMVCLALRLAAVSGYGRKLRLEGERLAKEEERRDMAEELHDTLKQSIYGTTLLLNSYRKVREKKGPEAAEEVLDRAIEASKEANHRVSRPIEELRALRMGPGSDFAALLRGLREDVQGYFGMEVHEDLRADLGVLDAEELAAAYRIVGEALWNAAKHSGAQNAWIESGWEASFVWVGVCDDGRGLDTEDEEGPGESSVGLGLSLMRDRAERTGGSLEVASSPSKGTTVKVMFRKE